MSEHTPGPWTVEEWHGPEVESLCNALWVASATSDGCGIPTRGSRAAEANLRLIAAAPELLEALLDLRTSVRVEWPDGANMGVLGDAMKRASAAIAKAEGRDDV